MNYYCPYCYSDHPPSDFRSDIVRFGRFRRTSDQKYIPRFRCQKCLKTFSQASFDPCYKQLKRQHNQDIQQDYTSGVSQRRLARNLGLDRKTIKRKLLFLGIQAMMLLNDFNSRFPKATEIEFDELETYEHTKCKPVSIPIAVEAKTRRILAFAVAQMPAKGRLVEKALKKYGPRPDMRAEGRRKVFESLKSLVKPNVVIRSDQNPHYPADIKVHFPESVHITVKGKRGAITGQGELKKVGYDPIFSLNHTCAMMRYQMSRMIRKTWCTSKKRKYLELHFALSALVHNLHLPVKTQT